MQPRLLVTGPVDGLEEYARAARAAQWDAIEHPLLAIVPREVDLDALDLARCDALCVTSSSALAFVDRARSEVGALPLWIVGEKSASRARALGLALASEPEPSSAELARVLLNRSPRPKRVLWPHGDQSDELARLLSAGGVDVVAPVVYATVARAWELALPDCDAVFFASPSAVREWSASAAAARCRARLAIAIGPTTFDALVAATGPVFRDILSLPAPESDALTFALAHVDRQRLAEPDTLP